VVVADTAVETPTNGPAEQVEAEAPTPKIHVPDDMLGREGEPSENGAEGIADETPKRKRTRRGSRGGRGRRKKPAAVSVAAEGAEESPE
jgi:hypothetical protein